MSKSFRRPILAVNVIFVLIGLLFLSHGASRSALSSLSAPLRFTGRLSPLLLPQEIPNIVHFVHLLSPPTRSNPEPHLNFEFSHFIAIYSAYIYLRPDVIYIHTDADADSANEQSTRRRNGRQF